MREPARCEIWHSSHQPTEITLHPRDPILKAFLLALELLDLFLLSRQVFSSQRYGGIAIIIVGRYILIIIARPACWPIHGLQLASLLGHASFIVRNVCFQLLMPPSQLRYSLRSTRYGAAHDQY